MENLKSLERYTLLLCVFSIPIFESPKTIFLILCFLLFIVRHVMEKDLRRALFLKDPRLGFLALVVAASLSAIFAANPGLAIHGSSDFLRMYFIFAIVATDFSDKHSVRNILLTVLVSTAAGSVWGFIEYVNGTTRYFELNSVGFTNHTAIYLGFSLAGAFFLFFNHFADSGRLLRITVAGCTVVILGALLCSSTRTTLSLGRVLFVFFILFFLKDKRYLKVSALFLILVSLVAILFFHNTLSTGSISDRVELWDLSWRVFQAHPFLGIGAKHFQSVNPSDYGFGPSHYLGALPHPPHPHNLYLAILSQLGAVGFFALILLFYFVLKLSLKANPSMRPLVVSAFLGVAVVGLVNITLYLEHGLIFSLLVAMAAGEDSLEVEERGSGL